LKEDEIGVSVADLRGRHGVSAGICGEAAGKAWCRKQDSNL
jgi:hypothetical protein